MISFKKYIAESTGEYGYVLKLAMEPSEAQVNTVESLLRNYQLVDISKPTKVEDERFDFFDVPTRDVWTVKFVTAMPVSSYIIMQHLRDALDVSEKYIIVRTATEPVELEAEDERFKNDAAGEANEKGFTMASRLSTDRHYEDAEQTPVTGVYGDAYNKELLAHLAGIKASRKSDEIEPAAPLFSWLDMKKVTPAEPIQDASDFNAHLDTPKPVSGKGSDKAPIDTTALGAHGNFDDGATRNFKLYLDKTNQRRAIVAPRATNKPKR